MASRFQGNFSLKDFRVPDKIDSNLLILNCQSTLSAMKTLALQLTLLTSLLLTISCNGQQHGSPDRMPAVAGSFYPADAKNLKAQIELFFENTEDKKVDENIAAIIVPHAGYIFSGQVAASAYARLDPEKTFKRIFVIGTSHHVLLNGASVYTRGNYRTPLGTVRVDTELATRLTNENRLIKYVPEAHAKEHSVEVQLPFLQCRLKKPFKIVPMVIGTQSANTCEKLAEILKPFFTPENLFVISSDFSHYPPYADALKTDQATGNAIAANSPAAFVQTILANEKKNIPQLATSCCGWSSVLTLLDITSQQRDISVVHVKYANSGDTPQYGDKDRVVGYHSFVFTRNSGGRAKADFNLTDEDKKLLLKLARESIESKLDDREIPEVDAALISENVMQGCGAFVTLTKNGALRGCVGRFTATEPLYRVVQEMARAAAFNDTRFLPVLKREMKNIELEISVLTPLKRIFSPDEFEPGKHGIYIIKGNRSGTFLPQVAESTGWSREELLGHCARDKAGIGWDGWKTADLYTYEALAFDEHDFFNPEQ